MSVQLVHNMNYIIDIFNHLSRQNSVPVCLKSESGIEFISSLAIAFKKNNYIEILIDAKGFNLQGDKYTCHILSASGLQELFSFEISTIDKLDEFYSVKLPDYISIYLNRQFSRFRAFTDYEQPYVFFSEIAKKFRIIDISPMGLSFQSDKGLFCIGAALPALNVVINSDLEIIVDAEIRHAKTEGSEKYVYGVYFTSISQENREKLLSYIFKHCYKNLEYISNISPELIHNLDNTNRDSSLSKLPIEIQTLTNKDTYNNTHELFLAIINKKNNFIDMEFATRIYSKTFFCFSTNTDINTDFLGKIDAFVGLLDAMLNSTYFKYYLSYIPIRSEYAQTILKLIQFTNEANNVINSNYHYFQCIIKNIEKNVSSTRFTCKELTDKTIFLDYCDSHLSTLEIECCDYTPQEIELIEIKNAFGSYNIHPNRKILFIENSNKVIIAYVIVENSVILAGDMCRAYIIENNVDKVELIYEFLSHAAQFFEKHNKECFNILIEDNEFDIAGMLLADIKGIKYKGILLKTIMNYKGLITLKNFMLATPAHNTKYHRLTYPQKSIWSTEEVYPGTSFANITTTIRIKEPIDFSLLEQAINLVVQLNDGIRMRILEKDSTIVQYVSDYKYKHIDTVDFSNQDIEKLYTWDYQQNSKIFNLINSDLFYFCMLKINDSEGGFYVRIHHIICDAWTIFSLIISKVLEYYSILKNGNSISPISRPSYFEYAISEDEYLHSQSFLESKKFWGNAFSTIPELMLLKPDLNIDRPEKLASARKTFIIPDNLSSKIKSFCRHERIPVFSFFLSIIATYLSRITSKQDIVIGVPVRNRSINEKEIMGMFVNTIPMRIAIDPELEFINCVRQVASQATEFLKHKKYPYELIQKDFRSAHKIMHNMFDVSVSYQSAPVYKEDALSDVNIRWHIRQHQAEPLIIHISDRDNEGSYIINLDYLTAAFSEFEINQMQNHLLSILQESVENPSKNVYELEVLSESEKHKVLCEFNSSKLKYPISTIIHQCFYEQVVKTPNNIALECNDQALTYSELNKKSNQLARTLRNQGINKNSIVGILVDRSLDMIISILGVLKSGGTYLPLDPDYPKDRILYMLEDCGTNTLITQSQYIENISFGGSIINVNIPTTYDLDDSDIKNINDSEDMAYVLYTSGSTGLPKGVMVSHKSVVNLLNGVSNIVEVSEQDSVLALTTISFDIFVFESLFPLSRGMKVAIATQKEQDSPNLLGQLILDSDITILQMTPSRMSLFLKEPHACKYLKNIKALMLTGEALPQVLYNQLKPICPAKIYNGYGPTEATVWATIKLISADDIVNIGVPIPNVKIYIVDNNMHPVPIGVAGELCIAGDGLAIGYLNNPDLTTEKFIFSPAFPAQRMYRTGDLAKWLPSGEIEVIGRIDSQVKIRGFRVELGEVENCLTDHPSIQQSAVILVQDAEGSKYLCGYVVLKPSLDVHLGDLKKYLADKLPYYMIPSRLKKTSALPLTPNGKIDRNALVNLYKCEPNSNNYIAPQSSIQKDLVAIWEKELNVNPIGLENDYFEIGGDSLKAVNIIYQIRQRLGVDITFRNLLSHPTIAGLSNYLCDQEHVHRENILPAKIKEFYPASFAQKRIFLASNMDKSSANYNIPIAFFIEGNLDIKRLANAFKIIIRRHESLRTSFDFIDGEITQTIHEEVEFNLDVYNTYSQDIINNFICPFDLSLPSLIRATLIRKNVSRHLLLIDIHHIVSDGISISILLNELKDAYQGMPLYDLKIQYKDFSEWQNIQINTEKYRKQREFWTDILKDVPSALDMPLDYIRPIIHSFKGDRLQLTIDSDIAERLEQLCIKTHSTLYMVLLTAYSILLYRYTGQEDIAVGTPVSGRGHADTENLIGVFINTLVMRTYPSPQKSFLQLLQETKDYVVKAFENQDYPFDKIVETLDIQRNPGRSPLFETMLSLQNIPSEKLLVGDLVFFREKIPYNISKFDITLNAFTQNKKIFIDIEYRADLFNRNTIKRFANCFINILNQATQNTSILISKIEILSHKEKYKVMQEFNNTYSSYPRTKTVHQIFEEKADKNPDEIALVFENSTMTYGELNSKSNKVAYILREKGVKPNNIVSIMMERSFEMVIGILGILKAGGAYLPIDPEYPTERIKYLLKDSQSRILILKNMCSSLLAIDVEYLVLDDLCFDNSLIPNLPGASTSTDLMYIMYTSGSTGKPKGAMIRHYNAVNLLHCLEQKYPLQKSDSFLFKAPYTFDASITELFGWFFGEGSVVILKQGGEKSHKDILDAIDFHNITHINFVPSMLDAFINLVDQSSAHILKKLKYIFIGGEKIMPSTIHKFYRIAPNVALKNMYGPTEATEYTTEYPLDNVESANIPIGKPLYNVQVYIVDKTLNLQPIGVFGELCISGDGIAKGYINQPQLSKEKFILNPFSANQMMYKTGDIVRWLENGNIEFLGRADYQVKIRGFRIELKEIEYRILKHPSILQAVATAYRNKENSSYSICLYYTATGKPSINELKEFILRELPNYMIPSYFIRLDKLPLGESGKVDMFKLPDPIENINSVKNPTPPSNKLEEVILSAYKYVLDISNIGIADNFFELGGDSIEVMKLVSVLNKHNLRIVPNDIYKFPTVKSLSQTVKSSSAYHNNISVVAEIKNSIKYGSNRFIKIEERSIYDLIVSEKLPTVDAAALTYIPDDSYILSNIDNCEILKQFSNNNPDIFSVFRTGIGDVAVILLPIKSSELYIEENKLISLSAKAIQLAQDVGAKVVSLTGLIPSATNYGLKVLDHINKEGFPSITTGHTTTCAAITLSLARLLEESHRDLSKETVCVLGVGQIGKSAIELILKVMPHPPAIILCDIYEKRGYLEDVCSYLKEASGYKGNIEVASVIRGKVPEQIYKATLIVGSTNVPDVIDVDRLNPGTLILDDSGPHCFCVQKAIDRIRTQSDILVTEGGMLETPFTISKILNVHNLHPNVEQRFNSQLISPTQITSCVLSSLLSSKFDHLKPVVGKTLLEDSLAHFWQLSTLKFRGAALHCENFNISRKDINKFRKKFRNK